jgi:hypothetical protein
MASAVPDPTARLIFRTWDDETDTALAAGLWGDSRVTELIGGPFDDAGQCHFRTCSYTSSLHSARKLCEQFAELDSLTLLFTSPVVG